MTVSNVLIFVAGMVVGWLISAGSRAYLRKHMAATEAMPPPDTIEARNARSLGAYTERAAGARREQ